MRLPRADALCVGNFGVPILFRESPGEFVTAGARAAFGLGTIPICKVLGKVPFVVLLINNQSLPADNDLSRSVGFLKYINLLVCCAHSKLAVSPVFEVLCRIPKLESSTQATTDIS